MAIYTYIANYGSYDSQTIVIIADDKTQALQKLKAYLGANGYTKLAIEAQEKDLTEETEDVFQTFGVDG
jgi:DUF438 domain-containing protein